MFPFIKLYGNEGNGTPSAISVLFRKHCSAARCFVSTVHIYLFLPKETMPTGQWILQRPCRSCLTGCVTPKCKTVIPLVILILSFSAQCLNELCQVWYNPRTIFFFLYFSGDKSFRMHTGLTLEFMAKYHHYSLKCTFQ